MIFDRMLRDTIAWCFMQDNGWDWRYRDRLMERLYRIPLGIDVPRTTDAFIDDVDLSHEDFIALAIENFDIGTVLQ